MHDIRISSREGGSFGTVRSVIGGLSDGVMGRDLGLCFQCQQDVTEDPPTLSFKRIHQKSKYNMFQDEPLCCDFVEEKSKNSSNENDKLANDILKDWAQKKK